MKRPPRLVLDTNVVISAILWGGKPGQLLTLVGEGEVRLHTSRVLLDELQATLERPKLARAVEATGFSIADMVADYRRLTASPAPPRSKGRCREIRTTITSLPAPSPPALISW